MRWSDKSVNTESEESYTKHKEKWVETAEVVSAGELILPIEESHCGPDHMDNLHVSVVGVWKASPQSLLRPGEYPEKVNESLNK